MGGGRSGRGSGGRRRGHRRSQTVAAKVTVKVTVQVTGVPTAERGGSQDQCPESELVPLPPTETLAVGSQVSLIRDSDSPSGVSLLYGNRRIPLDAESMSPDLRECVLDGAHYVGTIVRHVTDPTRLAALVRKE